MKMGHIIIEVINKYVSGKRHKEICMVDFKPFSHAVVDYKTNPFRDHYAYSITGCLQIVCR